MNKIIIKFLFTADKFMLELHLKQPGFTDSACEPFSKHCGRIQKFRETGNLKHSDSKDLVKTTISGKILKGSAYETA